MRPTYIYCLWCPIKRRIRYIGKSVSPDARLFVHLCDGRRGKHQYVSRWIGGLLKKGLRPRMRILHRVPDGESWQEHERRLIARCISSGRPMVNGTEGGEGYLMLTDEQREEHRQAIRASFTPESLRRRSASAKALWADPERRARIVAAQKSAASKPMHRARLAKGVKRSPEGEARRVAAVRAYFADPQNKAAAAKRAAKQRGPDGRMRAKSR